MTPPKASLTSQGTLVYTKRKLNFLSPVAEEHKDDEIAPEFPHQTEVTSVSSPQSPLPPHILHNKIW